MRQHYRPFNRAVTGAVGVVAAVLSLLVAMPGTASAVAPAAWRADGYGPGNTGYNPIETAINTDTVDNLQYQWSITSPVVRDTCLRQSPPVVANNRLYLTDQGGIGAYNATTGARVWRHAVASPPETTTPLLTIYGSQLFAASIYCQSASDPSGTLTVLNASTGAPQWSVTRDAPMSSMVVDKDIVVVSGEDMSTAPLVTAYRIADGSVLWERPGDLYRSVSANGRLLITRYDADAENYNGSDLVDIRTGAVLWSSAQTWTVQASGPAGGPLYVTTPAGELARVNVETGAMVWTVPGPVGLVSVDGPRLYITHGNTFVVRDAASGAQLWTKTFFGGQRGKPIIAGGVVYITTSGGVVDAYNATTGATLANEVAGPVIGHPVVVNGWMYVTNGRVLDAFAL